MANDLQVSRLHGYAVLRIPEESLAVSRLHGYAVLRPEDEVEPEPSSAPRVMPPKLIGW